MKHRPKPKKNYTCKTVVVCGVRRTLCWGPNGIKSNKRHKR